MPYYNTCPNCGATLDPNEVCDCQSKKKSLKVLSLFDGMACGLIALKELGVIVDRYVAFEIDKYAVKTSSHNFHEIEHRGDVFKADFTEFEGFDLLCGGSPCTYWSIAQSPDKREVNASGIGWDLFSQYVRALNEAKPKYFIYENNKSMAIPIYQSISETFGFEPIMINSALVSAQNRQRYYWVGKRNANGTYNKVDIQQPEDRGILLKDVLCGGQAMTNKAYCVTARINGACLENTLQRKQKSMVAQPVCVQEQLYGRKLTDDGSRDVRYEARSDGKTGALTTTNRQNSVAQPVRVGALPRPNGELSTSQSGRIYSILGKSTTQTAVGETGLYAVPIEFENGRPTKAVSCEDEKTYNVYEIKDGHITIKGKSYPIKLIDGFYIIRKLTVLECMRLQTVPEWYEFPVSNSQAYKMLGNGWTVEVIKHLLKGVLKND